jgi:hypothetical protein
MTRNVKSALVIAVKIRVIVSVITKETTNDTRTTVEEKICTSGFTLSGVKLCSVKQTYQFQIQLKRLAHPTDVFRRFALSSDANANVILRSYDLHHNRFLVNKTNRCTEFKFY